MISRLNAISQNIQPITQAIGQHQWSSSIFVSPMDLINFSYYDLKWVIRLEAGEDDFDDWQGEGLL